MTENARPEHPELGETHSEARTPLTVASASPLTGTPNAAAAESFPAGSPAQTPDPTPGSVPAPGSDPGSDPGPALPPEPLLPATPPAPPSAPPSVGAPIIDPPAPLPEPPPGILGQASPSSSDPGSSHPPGQSYPVYARPPRHSATRLVAGSVVLLVLLLAAAAFYLTRVDGRAVLTGGSLASLPDGLHYENAREKIAFTAPTAWSKFPTPTAQIMLRGNGCSFGLLEQHTMLDLSRLADAEAKDLHRRHPDALPVIAPRSVAGQNGLAFSGSYRDEAGTSMTQTYILIDRGANVLTLIETSTDASCAGDFDQVENSLRI